MNGVPVNADTLSGSGTVTSPGVNGVIATLTPPKGTYKVEAQLVLTGTAETAPLNANLRRGAAEVCKLVTPGVAVLERVPVDRVTLDGATALTVNAIAGGVAGAIYTAVIVAQQVE